MSRLILTLKPDEKVIIHKDGEPVAILTGVKSKGSQLTIQFTALKSTGVDRAAVFASKYPEVNLGKAFIEGDMEAMA